MFSMPPRTGLRRSGLSSGRHSGRTRASAGPAHRGIMLGILCLVVLAGLSYLVWWSGSFSIDELEVTGNDERTVQTVRKYVQAAIGGSNLLFVDIDLVVEELLGLFPQVRHVQIQRDWPRKIRVQVTSREPLGVWCRPLSREQECFLFDEEQVWGSAIPSRGTLLLTVMDEHPEGAPDAKLVATILMLSERLNDLDLNVSRVTLPAGLLDEIHIMTTDGFPVLLSQYTDLTEQLDVLEVFLSEQRARGDESPEYIDIRIPGKVYFK